MASLRLHGGPSPVFPLLRIRHLRRHDLPLPDPFVESVLRREGAFHSGGKDGYHPEGLRLPLQPLYRDTGGRHAHRSRRGGYAGRLHHDQRQCLPIPPPAHVHTDTFNGVAKKKCTSLEIMAPWYYIKWSR